MKPDKKVCASISQYAAECFSRGAYVEAIKSLRKGVALGDVVSIANLAHIYANGAGVERNCAMALELFVRSICYGASSSSIREIVLNDISEAELRSLADQGNENAQYYYALAISSENGPSTTANKYIEMACKSKMPLALAFNGLCLYICQNDKSNAITFLTDATNNGYDLSALLRYCYQSFNEANMPDLSAEIDSIARQIQARKSKYSYILAKITRKEYVDGFLKGEIYTQPLVNFRKSDQPGVGDMFEGIANTGNNQLWEDLLQSEAVDTFFKCGIYDEYMAHERLFCLYALEFDETGKIIMPDKRMSLFGDSVILITNVDAFIERYTKAIKKQHGNVWIGWGRVQYDIDFSRSKDYDEFSKTVSYAWQNEFRFVEDIANGRFPRLCWDGMTKTEKESLKEKKNKSIYERFMLSEDGITDYAKLISQADRNDLYEEIGPEIIQIGTISDICTVISMDEFLQLTEDSLKVTIGTYYSNHWDNKTIHKKPYVSRPIIMW